ncbi:MAG: hypothetical protein KDL87_17480, partial [Verrucomicrobiae bacterium]|nr:hypothetical protein [Verrucomicrobiae bacterium]
GPRAEGWFSSADTLRGGFHTARQMIALWDEPDPVTRAKMLVVFGLRALRDETPGKPYGAWDRAHDDLSTAIPDLGPAGTVELKRWITWCARLAPGDDLTERQLEWLGDLAGQLVD